MSGVALVTGGARRIGRAIVERLAAERFAVIVHAHRSRAEAEALAAAIVSGGGRAAPLDGDLADPDAVASLVARAAQEFGPLTLLVNNASSFEPDAVDTLDRALWARQFAVNLEAPVFLARDFARQVPAGGEGAVVNILDQRVLKPSPGFFSYGLTRASLHAATRTLAQALAPKGIRVNAVAPGPVVKSVRQSDADFACVVEALPLHRAVAAAEIAEAVLYLARARSVTGQTIAPDGGQHLAWETPDLTVTE